jgi:DNA topoisomerase I
LGSVPPTALCDGGRTSDKAKQPALIGRCTRRTPVDRSLREIASVEISLKDFRTLLASVSVLDALARAEPATSKPARRRQVLDAIAEAAGDLGNTPAICRESHVHETVVNAFEAGVLEQFAETLRGSHSTSRSERSRPR